jgi:hypothetical protein
MYVTQARYCKYHISKALNVPRGRTSENPQELDKRACWEDWDENTGAMRCTTSPFLNLLRHRVFRATQMPNFDHPTFSDFKVHETS